MTASLVRESDCSKDTEKSAMGHNTAVQTQTTVEAQQHRTRDRAGKTSTAARQPWLFGTWTSKASQTEWAATLGGMSIVGL